MHVFELYTKGSFVQFGDDKAASELDAMLRALISSFYEANTSLNLFNVEQECLRASFKTEPKDALKIFQEKQQRSNEIRFSIQDKYDQFDYHDQLRMMNDIEMTMKHEDWARGIPPREMAHNKIFIFAKSFLYSLDTMHEILKVISFYPEVPDEIKEVLRSFDASFPALREVRNSAHHMEDRVRGIKGVGKNKAPIVFQPVDGGGMKLNNGAIILNNLHHTKYGCTMSNGHYGEVDVSIESLGLVRDLIQRVLDVFDWKGREAYYPN